MLRSPRVRWLVSFAVATFVIVGPAIALACPVGQDPREDDQAAFLSMTISMSLLPLGLIGGLVGYLWKMHGDDGESSFPPRRDANEGEQSQGGVPKCAAVGVEGLRIENEERIAAHGE